MNKLLFYILTGLLVVACGDGEKKQAVGDEMAKSKNTVSQSEGEDKVKFPVYDFEGLEPLLNKDDGTTYIINFWATWCTPCLEELPYFERVGAEHKGNKVKVILVSLDLPHMWKSRLEPYVEKKGIQSEVVILDDPKQNEWIPKVAKDWGGGIPATLIYNKDKRTFYERGFTYDELNHELDKFIE